MRLDHIAYRVPDRLLAAGFFEQVFGYRRADSFDPFGDNKVQCLVLVPPERLTYAPVPFIQLIDQPDFDRVAEYHLPPEIFLSDGPLGTIVGDWVAERNGVGGIHHLAYQVESVEAMMKWGKSSGLLAFSSDEPMRCPGLVQVFTKPLVGGIVYEFIERTGDGFCRENVRRLMESTR